MSNTNIEQENLNKMLLEAAKVGSTALIEHFIQSGADPLAQDENYKTALEYTISGQHFEATKKLVELGALKKNDRSVMWQKIKEDAFEGVTGYEYTLYYRKLYETLSQEQYEEVCREENNDYGNNTFYSTPLLKQALDNNDTKTAQLLLNEGTQLATLFSQPCFDNNHIIIYPKVKESLLTPIIKKGNTEMIETLLPFLSKQRVEIIQDAIDTSIKYNQPAIFTKLTSLMDKEDKYFISTYWNHHINLAIENNQTEMVDEIFKYKTKDIQIADDLICKTAINGNVAILDKLLPYNENKQHWKRDYEFNGIKEQIYSSKSAFVEAARRGHTKVIEKLVDHGLDVNSWYAYSTKKITSDKNEVLSKKTEIPLFAAAENGHIETVKFLLEKGVSLDRRNDQNETVYDVAQKSQQFEIYELIQKEQKRRQEEQRKQQEAEEKKKVTALKISKAKAKLKNKTQDALALKEAGNVELNKAVIEENTINKINPTVLKLIKRKMSNNK